MKFNTIVLRKVFLLLALVVSAAVPFAYGQNVIVSGALAGNGSYPTLTAAFAAINAAAQTNATITVSVVGNTTEGPNPALLTQGTWTSLTVAPAGGARTISGTTTLGNALIRLDGADRVTIDGLNSLGNSLLLQNGAVSNTMPAPVIQFVNDASNNLIVRCTLQGAARAVVEFGGGVTTGNDNNTINLCDIGPVGLNLPVRGVFGVGLNDYRANTNVVVSNCTVHDYFRADGESHGIHLDTGHEAWTISNNRFFQTTPRTSATFAYLHTAINVATGPAFSNVTINGNVIGYANANGTGSYELTAPSNVLFYGILVSSTSSTAQTTIQGNRISSIIFSGALTSSTNSPSFAAIEIQGGAASVNGNHIGSLTNPGAIQVATTASNLSTTEVAMIHVKGTSSCNFLADTIGGIVVNTANNSTIVFDAIEATPAFSASNTINNAIIGSATAPININTTGQFSKMTGININGQAAQLSGNLVNYLTIGGGAFGSGTSAAVIGIRANCSGTTTSNIVGNVVQAIQVTGTSGNAQLIGMCINGSANVSNANLIERNKVQCLLYANATGSVTGIYNQNGKNIYQNNSVRIGMDLSGNSITQGIAWVGFRTTGGNHSIYHNSVYVGGAGVAGSQHTYAYNNDALAVSLIFNNIFMNARSNGTGTGKHYAIRLHGSAVGTAYNNADYNNIVATGIGGVFGYYAGIDRVNIQFWRTYFGHDMHSITADAGFVNPMGTITTGDLHLGPISAMEGAGTLIAGTTQDMDGQLRSAWTPHDIGADAANVASIISLSPAITYTAPNQYCVSGDLTFTANIALAAGVATGGGLAPRVYYRKGNGPVFSSPGVLSSGGATNGTWTFSVLAANVGGFAPGDVMSYYVIAQDVSGTYVIANPGRDLIAGDVNTVTSHPKEWNTYGGLQGNYPVGVGQVFPTLKGAVEAYNRSCLLGPVKFSLMDTVYYDERFPISIKANSNAAPTKQLTIQPDAGVITNICGDGSMYLIEFDGADYVNLNGSNTQVVNEVCPRTKAMRHLKLRNTGGAATIGLHNTVTGDSATHNKVMNCNLFGGGNTGFYSMGAQCVIAINGATHFAPGNGNNANVIENNALYSASSGINVAGGNPRNQGNVYRLNDISPDQSVQFTGIRIMNENAPVVHANFVNVIGHGIVLGFPDIILDTSSIGLEVTNADVRYNVVRNISMGAQSYSSSGIAVSATFSGTTVVANNFVQDVVSMTYPPLFCASIYYGGGTGIFRLYHNTIKSTNTVTTMLNNPNHNMAVAIEGNAPNVDMRNNIIHMAGYNGCQTNNLIGLGYTSTVGAYQNLTSNYNDLVRGSQYVPFMGRTGSLGATGPTHASLANWTAQTGADANSLTIFPTYLSFGDAHLPAVSNPTLNNQGTPILLITDDIDCESRNPLTPDIGADEMETCPPPVAGTISASASFCGAGSTTLYCTGYSPGSQYLWQSSPAGLNTWTNTGGTSASMYATGTLTSSRDFRLQVGCANGTIVYSNVITITINTSSPPTISIVANQAFPLCPGISASFTANVVNPGPSPTYQWFVNGLPAGTNSPNFVNPTPISGDQVTCRVTSNAPCLITSTALSNSISVTVWDVTFPVWANCPANQSVSTNPNSCDATVNWVAPTATDNCSLAVNTSTHIPGATFPIGTTTVTYTAVDIANLSATCNFTVTVTDQVVPTAMCQNIAVQLDTNGLSTITVANIDSGSTDACGILSMSLSDTAFTCADVGTNAVVLTVTDLSGNTSTCTSTVQITTQPLQALATTVTTACGYHTTCAGIADGAATVQATGGCYGHAYLWSNGDTTASTANLAAGTHFVTVTDGSGNVQVVSVTIIEPLPLALPGLETGTCVGDTAGAIDVTPSGGNDCQPYLFQWSNGATTEDLASIAAGTYGLTMTDVQGCSVTGSYTVPTLPAPSPTFAQNGNVLSALQAWASYQWLLNGNPIPGATASSYPIGVSGNYSLQVTDPLGCTGTSAPTTITALESSISLGLELAPNPASDAFYLRAMQPITQSLTVEVHDLLGQRLLQMPLRALEESVVLDASAWPSATYFLRVRTDEGRQQVFRLVVQR